MRLVLLLLIVACSESFAQKIFLTSDEFETSESQAYYYREIAKTGSVYQVDTYYMSTRQLRSRMTCSSVKPYLVRDGIVTTYYENGKVKSMESYVNGKLTGLNSYFTENGDSSEVTFYKKTSDPDKPTRQTYIQVWNQAGEPVLKRGSGILRDSLESGGISFRHFTDSVLTHAYHVDPVNQDTVYLVAEKSIEFSGGMKKYYEFIQKNLRYPAMARRMGIQGRVYVQFTIERDGAVTELKVLKGIGGGCDEEAVRVMSADGQKWLPARQGGRPVRAKVVLPITFRLG